MRPPPVALPPRTRVAAYPRLRREKKNVPTHLDYLDYLDRRYPKCNTTLARGMRPAGETSTVMPLRKPNATAGAVPQGAAAPVRTPRTQVYM